MIFLSYNGGSCVDGVNWYLCQCADGFAGPDCRISKYIQWSYWAIYSNHHTKIAGVFDIVMDGIYDTLIVGIYGNLIYDTNY